MSTAIGPVEYFEIETRGVQTVLTPVRIQRAVLDTNIVLSALLFAGGQLAPTRLAWQRAVFQPLVSRQTIEELIRTLGYPKLLQDHDCRGVPDGSQAVVNPCGT